ncbi:MAG TPA: type II secretion system minor pseudopilin GspJ [Gammaproteobacteria bacterium]|nr:type II secretion system minor pseudopilin GspJ [Gammaproteobacteria bacterium]
MKKMRGFTLIELMVALAITAIIMVIAYGGLRTITNNEDHSRAADKRLRQVQLAMRIMEQDFTQLEPRPVRDGLGGIQPPLLAGPQNVPPIIFTRGGWSNPLGITRSTEQRVAYSLEDGKLMRSWWPELDGQAQVVPAKEPLLEGVDSVKIQYMDPASKTFEDVWPPTQLAPGPSAKLAAPGSDALPIAVSITLTLKDMGEVTRIVEVASCDTNCNGIP